MFHLGLLTRPTSVHPGFVTLEFFPEMYSGLRSFAIWDELQFENERSTGAVVRRFRTSMQKEVKSRQFV